MRDGINLAKLGIPSVALVTEEFWSQGNFVAQSLGMTTVPRVELPHPVAGTGSENLTRVAESIAGATFSLRLRLRVTEILSALDEAQALEDLHRNGCTDGLPGRHFRQRNACRVWSSRRDRTVTWCSALWAQATALPRSKTLPIAAVMAGCLPDYMPVVLAAVKAVIDPVFDLTEMQATTHCTAPLVIVNGPARHSCGPIASGTGALGPGHRANASIGRALRLTMINIGKAQPGSSDMALLGHPGKFTYCLAEDEENSPFTPLHVGRGFDPDDSVVTVLGAEAPHSVIFSGDGNDPESYKALLELLAMGLANPPSNNGTLTGGHATVVLNPEHSAILHSAGLDPRGHCSSAL